MLTAALSSVADAVVVTDVRGVIRWVNPAFTELSGYRLDEVVGATPRVLRSGAHDDAFYRDLWSTILAGRTWRGEVVERHKSGRRYTVSQTITPLPGEGGTISHFVAVHDDVTRLRESQARHQALFDHALDAILLFDDDARILDANQAVHTLIGYQPEELVGMSVRDLAPDHRRDDFEQEWARLFREGRVRGHNPLRHRNGELVDVEYQVVTGILPGVHLAIARDVTAQRAAEASRRFQAQLLGAVGEAVIATDLDGVVRYWNAAAERLYGWSAEEVLDRPLPELAVGRTSEQRARTIRETVRSGRTWVGEYRARRRDGSTFPALVTDSPYFDGSGAVAGIIGVFTDITGPKAAEEQLARRAAQQAAVAELGRLALVTDDLAAVVEEARRTAVRGLSAGAAPTLPATTAAAPTPALPTSGTDLDVVAPEGTAALGPEDREFLRSVTNVLDAARKADAARRELEHLATHDPVTGLPTRMLLFDRLEHARGAAQRSRRRFAVLSLDIDGFRYVNDGLGPDKGDAVLAEVADRMRRAVRPGDTVARLGGDQFAVLCPDAGDDVAAMSVAVRVQGVFHEPLDVDGTDLLITASVGVAFGDADSDSVRLLRDADAAMYRAKDRGRNRVEVYDTAMQLRARRRLDLAAQLRRAIDDGRIEVHYQPIVGLTSGTVVGVEALARWRLPNGLLVSPGEFVPLAEDTGLIGPLGLAVLEQACDQARGWADAAGGDFFVAVNVSPRQFSTHGFGEAVIRTLAETGLDPSNLHLEITESALMQDEAIRTTMVQLHGRGIRFAIDDFGTGYSSLSYLRRMPADVLKIDRSFVSGLTIDLQDRALVTAAIGLARTFGIATVAEGVETPRQLSELTAFGCDYAQGYLWSPPTAPYAIAPMIQRRNDALVSSA